MSEHTAETDVIHEPRCNTNCTPGTHYLTSGIGFPHIHRTDLVPECGECVTPPAPQCHCWYDGPPCPRHNDDGSERVYRPESERA